jgi:hypothetical protein
MKQLDIRVHIVRYCPRTHRAKDGMISTYTVGGLEIETSHKYMPSRRKIYIFASYLHYMVNDKHVQ